MTKVDILVVGAGLAGAGFAAALRGSRYSLAVVEGRPPAFPSGWDARVYAISAASKRFLSGIGIWQHLDPARMAPVYDMEIHGDRGGRLDFSAYESGVDELAWIMESSLMQRELWETIRRQANIRLVCPGTPQRLSFAPDCATLTLASGEEIQAALVVAADGARSWVRQAAGLISQATPYNQKGVVANFRTAKPHRNVAFQWFRPDGVLAYLPLPGNLMSMVWSTPDDHADELVALPPEALCARVAEAGQHTLGDLELVTPAAGFPLRLLRVPKVVAPRLALIGDAAHGIHPLSGHGINLGYQDARVLAEELLALSAVRDCGDYWTLRRYERKRAEEVNLLQLTTHGLQRLFLPQNPLLAGLRNAGLELTNRLPIVRNVLVRYALG